MARDSVLLGGLLGLVLAAGLAVVAISRPLDQRPVYTVAQVQVRLAHQPGAWVGRTIRVRGRATACYIRLEHGHFHCIPQRPRLSDPDAGPLIEPLLLAREDPNPALTFMRRVPLLGSLLPAPQAIDWGEIAIYRVELRAMPGEQCSDATCYEALLLDAAP